MRGLVLRTLHVYPVKSCGGIALDEAALERRGLRHDCRWMVVDEAGVFLTQRTEPRMALVRVAIESGGLVLEAPGQGALRIAPATATATATASTRAGVRVRVWRDEVDAVDCGAEAAAWMSEWLGRPARVVAMPDDCVRAVNPDHAHQGDIVGFADGFPLLVATTASLEDLNSRLDQALPMDCFRPNLVIEGSEPWAEDGWKRIRIGDLTMRVSKPCSRCVVTTTDQQTAARGVEPLRTLATFRRDGNDVLFGRNAIPEGEGLLRVGDAVTLEQP